MTTTEQPTLTPAQQKAAGLRALADFIEANPGLEDIFSYTLTNAGINAHPDQDNKRQQLADIARAALRSGAKVTKQIDEQWHNLVLHFGVVKVDVLAYRSEVCERVVTGVETVTRTVPDPEKLAEVPTVEVVETVETYEWRCTPILSAALAGMAAE